MPYNAIRHDTIGCDTIRCEPMRYDAIRHDTVEDGQIFFGALRAGVHFLWRFAPGVKVSEKFFGRFALPKGLIFT